MKKYLLIYTAPKQSSEAFAKASPEEKAAGMKPWIDWKQKYDGQISDFGAPVIPGQVINSKNDWNNSKSKVSGYSLIEAKSITQAKAMLKNHPALGDPKATVELHECLSLS